MLDCAGELHLIRRKRDFVRTTSQFRPAFVVPYQNAIRFITTKHHVRLDPNPRGVYSPRMDFFVATLMAALLGISQLVCACPIGTSSAAVSGPEIAAPSHQSDATPGQTPCDDNTDHCEPDIMTVAKSDTSVKRTALASLTQFDIAFDATVNRPSCRVRAPPKTGVVDSRQRLGALSPVQLKVRFLN